MNNKKLWGVSLLGFIFSLAGMVISAFLMKEDVISTAKTVFEYFPSQYGVTPSTTWEGAIVLGVFVSVLQVVAASVAFSSKFSLPWRALASVALASSLYFDNWTDIIFRSGYGKGDRQIATISTLAFYTFGSEVTQSLSWLLILSTWRAAVSDLLWGWYQFKAKWSSIGAERKRFEAAAFRKEFGDPPKPEPKPAQESRKVGTLDKNRYNRPGIFTIHKK